MNEYEQGDEGMSGAGRDDLNTKMCAPGSLCIEILKTKLPTHNF